MLNFAEHLNYFLMHLRELKPALIDQLYLVITSIICAFSIAIFLCISTRHHLRLRHIAVTLCNLVQTIPGLALLTLLLPLLGIGSKTALCALILYALLPIVRNTLSGFNQIASVYLEAAQAMGMTAKETLFYVEIPLVLPYMISGVRIATISNMGLATIATFIGAGGLGDFINRGLAMNDMQLILLGAIPVALLALFLDFFLAHMEKLANRLQTETYRPRLFLKIYSVLILLLLILIMGTHHYYYSDRLSNRTIVIGSKNFAEQFIIAEILSQLIENHSSLKVIRKFNLGSSAVCHEGMLTQKIDMYPEYTGTAYMTILHEKKLLNPAAIYKNVKQDYAQKFNIVWFAPLGFNNSQSIAIRKKFAQTHQIKTMSELIPFASQLIVAGPAEFEIRDDALPLLRKMYGFQFKKIKILSPSLMYSAINTYQVDAIYAFSTDGRLRANQLFLLADDQNAAPAYEAAILASQSVLKLHPELNSIISLLNGKISTTDMQNMNYEANIQHHSIKSVAHQFLKQHHLLNKLSSEITDS